jgi:glutamate/tyrosine decarboxylase-like PLP-dependent enzyme
MAEGNSGHSCVRQLCVRQRLPDGNDRSPASRRYSHRRLRRTDEIISAINATGEAFFTRSNWKSRRVMRISVCNWQTTASDVDRAVSAAALELHASTVHDALNRTIPS